MTMALGNLFIRIQHFRSTPFSFEPPKTANVSETYIGPILKASLREALERSIKKKRPFLNQLIKLRNLLVKRFGLKTDLGKDPYGPFDVKYVDEDFVIIRYDDPHFSFYGEGKRGEDALTFHCGVHFKTPTGMIYFWSIYLFHVQVFKSFMRDLY